VGGTVFVLCAVDTWRRVIPEERIGVAGLWPGAALNLCPQFGL